jgi:simple sugar transport system ATP-binding protein
MTDTVVTLKNITKIFGTNVANENVTLNLKKGSIHGLLGENGAGKTTLMNVLYGLYKPTAGQILVNGEKVEIDNPSKALELGIGMVHQHFMLVKNFTVVENIVLGPETQKLNMLDLDSATKKIEDLCQKYKIKIDPTAKISQLSVGEQQRVEILSAIYSGADILILDEPTAVLTPQEVKELFQILRLMRDSGKSVIFITHKLEEILEIGDEISVLRDGKLVDTIKAKETTKQQLTNMMVGREVLFQFSKAEVKSDRAILKTEDLQANNDKGLPALQGINLKINNYEILGIAGVDGNGQKELCEVLTGIRPATKGSIWVADQSMTGNNPKEFIQSGVAHIPEDRHKTGLVMNLSVMKNCILKEFDTGKFSKGGFLNFKAIKETAEQVVADYKVKTSSIDAKVRELSGGNQQKIILGREINCTPKVLIANQPTRGLDIGATEYVRQRLINQKEQGVAVLLISADLEELIQISDRIAVMYEGKIMGILGRDEIDIETIGLMMAGVKGGVASEKEIAG